MDNDGTVVLMHDTLITRWPRLRELVDGAKEPLRWKRRSFEGRYAERASLRGRPLEQAEEYVEEAPAVFADAERAYVHAQRRAARGRTAVWILAPVALVGVAGVIFAFTHRSDSAVTAAVKSAGNLETRANGIAADNPVHARALLLEAYRQRPHDLESRNALAEAVSLAPSLVATGSTTGGAAVLPDLSEVIEPNGVGCARVHTAQGVVSSRKEYCGVGPADKFVASPGSVVVSGFFRRRGALYVATWRVGEEQPAWSTRVGRVDDLVDISGGIHPWLAVADDGTAATADQHTAAVCDGATHDRIASAGGLPAQLGSGRDRPALRAGGRPSRDPSDCRVSQAQNGIPTRSAASVTAMSLRRTGTVTQRSHPRPGAGRAGRPSTATRSGRGRAPLRLRAQDVHLEFRR